MVETCRSAGLRVTFRRCSRLNRTASLTARTGRTSELNATARENRLRSFMTVFEAWYPAYSESDRGLSGGKWFLVCSVVVLRTFPLCGTNQLKEKPVLDSL